MLRGRTGLLFLSLGLIYMALAKRKKNHSAPFEPPIPLRRESSLDLSRKRFGEDKNRDVVEEASWESFPASDPPAW